MKPYTPITSYLDKVVDAGDASVDKLVPAVREMMKIHIANVDFDVRFVRNLVKLYIANRFWPDSISGCYALFMAGVNDSTSEPSTHFEKVKKELEEVKKERDELGVKFAEADAARFSLKADVAGLASAVADHDKLKKELEEVKKERNEIKVKFDKFRKRVGIFINMVKSTLDIMETVDDN